MVSLKKKVRYNLETFLLLSPFLILFAVFGIFPIVYSFFMSFTDYSALSPEFNFVGLKNYIKAFQDEVFLVALKNTVIFVVGTIPFTTVFSLLLAVLINSKFLPLKDLFKAGFFLPSVISMVVISTTWMYLYSADGFFNKMLEFFGQNPIPTSWLANTKTALLSIMIMDIWAAIGYYTILFLAGLQSIPQQLYEAAAIDGANKTKMFFKITLPLLKPTMYFVIALNTIRSFQIFSEIFTMTGGGPMNATQTIVHYLYIVGFRNFEMGYASAIAYILVLIILTITLLQGKLLRSENL
ncbi:carbohydrate ABC transporter permease [Thermosipho melanesiensis]|uniref:Binding-protein-dependent transport systems inner membrane component n=1 Tax=Thermosipho melanesiensis (strain DSM 12029 / CIP 104789 / BI429) TaxID=391009 RepID=A6LKV4_THEM4|nr:sugar ABC transporter permease [Thermosipho melanesiensis]ABR30555.1 binding-protein-dependent transport systems inner membrane component [Thermosipho melanesiensis BI429]